MDVLISLTAIVAEYTFAPIGRQMGYLIFYRGNFKKLVDHVKEHKGAIDKMNRSIEEERRNGKEIETNVLNWLKEGEEVIIKANQLLEDPHRAQVGCSRWSFPNLILRHQLSRNATKLVKKIIEVDGKGKFDQVSYLPTLDGVGSSSITKDGEKFETRESIKEKIVQALRNPEVRNIGVYGLGGVGKTTLVKEIAQIAKQEKMFDAVVITKVSKTPDLKTIQGEIADLLGLRFDEETVTGRAYRLRQRIKSENTILIILDDIWERLDLEEVGIPSADELNSCKLLMTSRNKEKLLAMDVQKNFRLEVLSDAETWNLFQYMAGDVVKDINLRDVAPMVAKMCAGLPLRIVTIARGLRTKDIFTWNDALKQLESADYVDIDVGTYSALELSYNWLESDEIKEIFLLFAVLRPESIEYILKVAMGLDIFKHINNMNDARNRLHKLVGSLKASCLFLESSTNVQIQMHDIVHEFAISKASRDKHVFSKNMGDNLKEWPNKEFLKRCSQIILYKCHIHELPQRIECPNIKFFLLCCVNRSLQIPDAFFEGMKSLTVLDLTHMNLSSLPTSFWSLTNLQTLCLDFCVLKNMDAIGAFKNLEILSFYKSSMIKLPNEIQNLTHLRMLCLTNSGVEVIPPNIISSLTRLEELYVGNISTMWDVENSTAQNENANLVEFQKLSNLTALELQICEARILPKALMFEKLKTYKIVIGDVWEWSDIDAGTLKTLMLKLDSNIHLVHGIKVLIKRVENLYLDDVNGIHNVLYQLNAEGFPLLKHLHIQNNAKMNHIIDSMERDHQVHTSFPCLETLVLRNLINLEKICRGSIGVNSFGKLRVIKVENCVQLKYLLSFGMVKGLSHLSEIKVCECNSMKKIVLGDSNACTDKYLINFKIEFPSLRSLTLQHLQTLDNFFSCELLHSITKQKHQRWETYFPTPFFSNQVAFPNLNTLELSSLNLTKIWDGIQHSVYKLANLFVEDCGGLKYLFSSTMVESFMNLKQLEISKCHLMDEIISTENDTKKVGFSKLETITLRDMENLKTIWHYQFETLKKLQVKNCEKITVVFPSSVQETYLNLEVLEIIDCGSVEEMFQLSLNENSSIKNTTTHLKEITLITLPKLKKIWSTDPQESLSFHNLESVYVENCENMEYLFPFSIATYCSHLKELHLKQCGKMNQIVAEKNRSLCTTPIFDFNELNSLLLWDLDKIKGFYAKNHVLACSSLRTINVSNCANLNLFNTISTSSSRRFQDGKLPVSMPQPLFIAEEVIPNLEELIIGHEDANKIMQAHNTGFLFNKMKFLGLSNYNNEEDNFPFWFLQNAYNLESLVVDRSSFRKIFQDEKLVNGKVYTQLKKLTLNQLPKLQHICDEGSQIDPVLEVLEYLHVVGCHSMTNLLPSSVTFSHMRYLEITNCNGLISLIMPPTASSLVKLETLKVKECNSLAEIITEKGNDTICEIVFINLESLILEGLPRLNKFCSSKCFIRFPLLEEVIVSECPCMKIFSEGNTSTPYLRKVKTTKNKKEGHWMENLNGTIKKMFEYKFSGFEQKLTINQSEVYSKANYPSNGSRSHILKE